MMKEKAKLEKLREPLKEVEELLTDLRAAIEDEDLDEAKSLLDDYFEQKEDDDE